MEWINVDENYLDYLRKSEERIPRTDYGKDKYKPFFGVLYETNGLYYVTQISHPQPRHYKLKQQKDFYKVYASDEPTRLIAVINLNYMFPILKSCMYPFSKKMIHTYRTFSSDKEKSKYIHLLDTELSAINKMNLDIKAKELYSLKINNPNHVISKRCIDFRLMESLGHKYINQKNKDTD